MSCKGDSFGSFRQQATIQTLSSVDDGAGGHTDTWADSFTFRCKISEKSGRESFPHQDVTTNKTKLFVTRYDARIQVETGVSRIKFNTQIYNIVRVNNVDEMNATMKITAELETLRG